MCKAPKPPQPKEPKKPQFLRNKYLDEFVGQAGMVKSLRTGRASLRVPLGAPSGIGGRQAGDSLVPGQPTGTAPVHSVRPPGTRGIRRNTDPRVQTR